MPHGDDVAVVLEHVHGVLDALLVKIAGARHLGVGEPEHVPAQAVHGRLGGQPGAGARLVERGEQGLGGEQVPIAAFLGVMPELVGDAEHLEELVAFEILKGQNVPAQKASHVGHYLSLVNAWPYGAAKVSIISRTSSPSG